MSTFADNFTLFQEKTKIFFVLIALLVLIALIYHYIEPIMDTLLGTAGY